MNEIEQYRKDSAEWMGFEISFGRVVVRDKKGNNTPNKWGAYGEWEPDQEMDVHPSVHASLHPLGCECIGTSLSRIPN